MANSGRVSGGSYAGGDEGEQKQNKLLALDLSVEEMSPNQVSYDVLKLRLKGKHEEADGLSNQKEAIAGRMKSLVNSVVSREESLGQSARCNEKHTAPGDNFKKYLLRSLLNKKRMWFF